ncbi:MAG TPA: hypothetical protein VFC53_03220 [Dehalococcoidia bacterium]|nr:hypothetical protein [Dehalococcoidia bacterium]
MLVVATAVVAGITTTATSGAATDAVPVRTATPTTVPPTPTSVPVNPPAAPVEQPAVPATGANPNGNELGVNNGPAGLPNAGDGTSSANGDHSILVLVLLGIAGAATLGTGALAVARRRS